MDTTEYIIERVRNYLHLTSSVFIYLLFIYKCLFMVRPTDDFFFFFYLISKKISFPFLFFVVFFF